VIHDSPQYGVGNFKPAFFARSMLGDPRYWINIHGKPALWCGPALGVDIPRNQYVIERRFVSSPERYFFRDAYRDLRRPVLARYR
jgi:hypothetical protein